MDYKEKYEQALEKVRVMLGTGDYTRESLEYVFPELKESEDERIRKAFVNYFDDANKADENPLQSYGIHTDKVIAWLEKQGELNNKIKSYKITFEDVLALECSMKTAKITKGGDELYKILVPLYNKIHNVYLDEKQGEQKPAKQPYGYELEEEIEEWLGCEAFPEGTNITPLPKAMEIVRETANHFYDFGRKQQAIRNIQYTNSQVITPESYINEGQKKGIQTVLDNPQEYGLQKLTDKAEPKFHVGDIIIHKENGAISKVNKILSYDYELISFETENTLFLDQNIINENNKLWTIQDAKDGDFLVCKSDKHPFIFKGFDRFHPDCPVAYCGITDADTFSINTGDGWWTDEEVFPANKEQREQLEKAISDAGYIWDAEKRELKEIEQKSTDEEMKTLLQTEYEKGRADAIVEKSWSEEDEKQLNNIMWIIEAYRKNGFNETHIQIASDSETWLKSLKDRVQPQHEWNKEDEKVLHAIRNALNYEKPKNYLKSRNFEFTDILDWLKSLRPQNIWKPSEEQLKALEKECIAHSNYELCRLLEQLKKLMEE